MAAVIATHGPRGSWTDLVEREIIAGHQSADWVGKQIMRWHRPRGLHGPLLCHGINAGLDVELARLAVGAGAIPIVETVGYIARLLDFCNEQPRTNRVYGAGWDKNAIARFCFK